MNENRLIDWSLKFLRRVCPEELVEEIEGDLLQQFQRNLRVYGPAKAKFKLVMTTAWYLRPGILFRNRIKFPNDAIMLKNYFTVSLRNIGRHPLHSFINTFSLTIGLAVAVVLYLFVTNELNFDTQHKAGSRIFRIYGEPHYAGSNVKRVALTPGWLAPLVAQDIPEVESFTRYWSKGRMVFKLRDQQFVVDQVAAVDSTFLKMFSFPLLSGNSKTALNEPNTVVLTEKLASHFFSITSEAVGQTININEVEFLITGVMRTIPEQTHLQFDALQSISTYSRTDRMFSTKWDGSFLNSYLLLRPDSEPQSVVSKLPALQIKYTGIKDPDKTSTLKLQLLKDVHLGSMDMEHDYNNHRKFNGTYIHLLAFAGIFVLVLACVNFMNLSLARASDRWKEIGVRKSIGAQKSQLFGQFISEAILMTWMALIIALVIDNLALPYLNTIFHRNLDLAVLLNPLSIALLIAGTILLGLITGWYPAYVMTSINVTSILKGASVQGKSSFQSSLVVVQYAIAIAMIIATIAGSQQMKYLRSADIGFEKDQIVLIDMNAEVNQKFEILRTQWLNSSLIEGVTASSQRLGNNFNGWGFKVKSDTGIYNFSPSNVNVDFDYLKVYKIKLKDGRDFSRDLRIDRGRSFIINETMAASLNMDKPVGTEAGHSWYENDSLGSIIGVVKDFNYNSLHNKVGMLAMVCHPEWGYEEISIKINGQKAEEAIVAIQQVWNNNISTYPFTYSFLDDHFNTLYESDQQLTSIISITAFLAILISCMGLFGLVAITVKRRLKEIAIRMILGATSAQIASMLSMKFAQLVIISFVIVAPLVYYLISLWLENFTYRISLNATPFVLGGFLTLAISLLTISFHTIRSSGQSSIIALKQE